MAGVKEQMSPPTLDEEDPQVGPPLPEDDAKPDSNGWNEALTPQHVVNPPQPAVSDNIVMFRGKEWQVSPDEARIKAQFEIRVRRGARQNIALVEAEEGPDAGDRERSVFGADWTAGKYTYDGEYCVNFRRSTAGLQYLLYLMMNRCHPEFVNGKRDPNGVTEDIVLDMFVASPMQCLRAIGWAVGNFPTRLKRLAQAEVDAKASAGGG